MSDEILYAGGASVWAQPYGPNTKPEYLGCHEVGDIEEEMGDITVVRCPDPAKMSGWRVVGSFQGEPGSPSTSLTTLLTKSLDWLEKLKCPATIFVHKGNCGRRDVFANWDRDFALYNSRITGLTYAGVAVRDPADETPTTLEAPLQAEAVIKNVRIAGGMQAISSAENLLSVAVLDAPQCAGPCGPYIGDSQHAVVVGNSAAGSAATPEIFVTDDGGATWTATAADPFAAGEAISSVVYITADNGLHRIIVARGTTDPANPAEIAYSDDGGATWALVDVGAVDGEYVVEHEGMFALDPHNIWIVTDGGYIYHSNDQAETWTLQDAGVAAGGLALNAVEFVNANVGYAVGATNTVVTSEDGGAIWTALTGPGAANITALAVPTETTVWVGDDAGDTFYSMDGGITWAERAMPVAATAIQDIMFVNPLNGYLIYNTVAPVGHVLRTINGGYSWAEVQTPDNAGLNALAVFDVNGFYAVGEASGGTAVIIKAEA